MYNTINSESFLLAKSIAYVLAFKEGSEPSTATSIFLIGYNHSSQLFFINFSSFNVLTDTTKFLNLFVIAMTQILNKGITFTIDAVSDNADKSQLQQLLVEKLC
jgi:hypothetical protein